MAETSSIEWTDATWNPVTGCSVVSPGCTNCYAMRLAGTRLAHHPSRAGLTRDTKAGPVWTGEVRVNWDWIDQPLTWSRPRRIFVCAHGDLFHEEVGAEDLSLIYGTMIAAHHLRGHQFQVLTKRSARARQMLNDAGFWQQAMATATAEIMDRTDPQNRRRDDARATCGDYGPDAPPPGIWLGVSAEDQTRADERIPDLLATPAAVRFVSAEPLLGPIDFWAVRRYNPRGLPWIDALSGLVMRGAYLARSPSESSLNTSVRIPGELPALDWVIVGGESGNGARPMHPDWGRGIRDQCETAGVPFFLKQWGEWAPQLGAIDLYEFGEVSRRQWAAWNGDDGRWDYWDRPMWCDDLGDPKDCLVKVGKRAAGRLLDGRTHDAMPAAGRAAP